ncbi:flagellar hook-associated protein FlgK [Desulfobacter hydrogenophilus]|uniref:Flagellar hook-associated protein 1 n=1 Tax=Desulfobacter hydrogenophilus TaxID=2291 RepID=A0A328FD84_9BACT|nr:flagellar hook-associated protein FlgK [Desulfobacter hydrogenophilus]NDY70499.1 flagellar hook-associated protein FlgK [Desulfobacter hydrogenophilus]QBH13876.1 flagellar hook-associated protein FlgK [Desulfobacter hydrogenophilus]RAM02106.1 flagellar hook-associated protein FlgK [Desulfobacter hydrogenophilus]
MSSLNAILNTASNAVTAYQAAISVTGQNIANADNDDYSIQSVELSTTSTVNSRGNIYGTGVTVASVTRSVNQLLENTLTSELSNQAALEEAQVYMSSIEDLFSEDSDDSLNTLLDAYWSAWEDLSNNPSGETEQNAVYDAGLALTDRINAIEDALSDLTGDLNGEISSAVTEVNSISEQIAALNLAIVTAESTGGNANDLADERNALVDDLGKRIDIDITVKEDGSYLILTNGLPLAEDGISYDLSIKQGSVYWTGKSGNAYDITDDISGGAIAGWLEVRDVVIPETQAEFDELATNLIWTLNYQHSQGAGQTYFSGSLEGTYEAGKSGTFDSLYYGDEIDYTKDFSMVIQDATDTTSEYQTATVDMAISTSEISNITGTGEDDSTYELTVIDEGILGDKTVVQSSGLSLGGASSSASGIDDALDAALAEQTLTITNGSDTQTLEISDRGVDATRSAADIAKELSNIDGIAAYASTTSAYFNFAVMSAGDGDVVEFTLSVDGVIADVSFSRDVSEDINEQLEDALKVAVETINEVNQNTDLAVDGTSIESASGATIGIYEFNANTGDRLSVSLDSSDSEIQFLTDNPATDDAVVITGSVTIVMDPSMEISSDSKDPDTGLFGDSGESGSGFSMITLGGTDGYTGFDDTEKIEFELDGYPILCTVDDSLGTSDADRALQLYTSLSSGLSPDKYTVIKNGTSVTIVKIDENDQDAIEITNFRENGDENAVLSVSTGTGFGSESPENDTLISDSDPTNTRKSTTAATFGSPATIYWEILDSSGNSTGEDGYVEIDESGVVEITEDGKTTLSFDISQGSLVAGNTLRINTDADGQADILRGSVTGKAASVDDTYEFTVISGGTLPDNEEGLVIEWKSETDSGTIELEGNEDEKSQIIVEVDGMTIAFDSGTLVNGDVFYVTTDDNGKAVADADGNTLQTLSDWHWTLDSFADEFNRSAGGVTASVTKNDTILFDTTDNYCAIENVTCSGSNNIDEANFEITVLNYSALEIEAAGLEFVRDSSGTWSIDNDPTGITTIIPEGGDDDGFQIDLDGDGIGDIEITFDQSVSGEGYIRMDLESKDAEDLSYAFAGNEDGDSGFAAALGLNTFFTGTGASNISVNGVVSYTDLLASGIVDTQTGALASSDNTNALAMADTRYDSVDMKAYTYTRGEGVTVTVATTSLDDYQASLVSTIGSTASGINSALEYSETLVYQLTEHRDSTSAVSLDEEMINLTAQQQAYLAAAKLLTMVQEMFDALLATR